MAAKFPLLVPGKPVCLKVFLGEVDAQLKKATACKMEVSPQGREQRSLQAAQGTWAWRRILLLIHKVRSPNK